MTRPTDHPDPAAAEAAEILNCAYGTSRTAQEDRVADWIAAALRAKLERIAELERQVGVLQRHVIRDERGSVVTPGQHNGLLLARDIALSELDAANERIAELDRERDEAVRVASERGDADPECRRVLLADARLRLRAYLVGD